MRCLKAGVKDLSSCVSSCIVSSLLYSTAFIGETDGELGTHLLRNLSDGKILLHLTMGQNDLRENFLREQDVCGKAYGCVASLRNRECISCLCCRSQGFPSVLGDSLGLGRKQDIVDNMLMHDLRWGMKWRKGHPNSAWRGCPGCSPSMGCFC